MNASLLLLESLSAKFSHSKVKCLVQASLLGSFIGNGDKPLERVQLVHRLMFKAAGMDCRCCFLSPWTTNGIEELLLSFNYQLWNTKKLHQTSKSKKTTTTNYYTLRNTMHYIKQSFCKNVARKVFVHMSMHVYMQHIKSDT